MPLRHHSSTGQSAYHDLRRILMDAAIADMRGTPTRVTVKGRIFWYDKYRVGNAVGQRYIGPDSPELRERLDRLRDLKAESDARRREQARLVRILRAEGYASTDGRTGALLSAFAGTGVFRLGGTVVGTVAFRHYEGELGLSLGFDQLTGTRDLDIASFERLSFALEDRVETPLTEVFAQLRFRPLPSLDGTKVWRWEQASGEALVEFLMPAHGDEGVRDLPALGISAQAIRHLDYLLEEPVPAVSLYRSGVLIQIPRPERFAFHKMIVAERRSEGPDALKAHKDRAQAAFLVAALAETRPDDLREAYEAATARGPRWRERIGATLRRLPGTADTLAGLGLG